MDLCIDLWKKGIVNLKKESDGIINVSLTDLGISIGEELNSKIK